jgi:hypothetical protein
MSIEGGATERGDPPRPDLPLAVGLNGGFVHSALHRSRRDGWFEVTANKASRRRWVQVLRLCTDLRHRAEAATARPAPWGIQADQQVSFPIDGADDMRATCPWTRNPTAEQFLDWFHIAAYITLIVQMTAIGPVTAVLDGCTINLGGAGAWLGTGGPGGTGRAAGWR